MATLSGRIKRLLTNSGMEKAVVDNYKVQNLKRRLIQHHGKKIPFPHQYERNRSDLVCSPLLNLAEIINLVAEPKQEKLLEARKEQWPTLVPRCCITQPLSFEVK